jgi:hypothetical protein
VEFFGTQGSIFWEKCQNSMALDVVTQQVHDFKVQKFVMGMFGNQVSNSYTRANLKLLCMTLRHFWPSHAFYYCSNVCFQSLCKFAQTRDIFILDFVFVVKICQDQMFKLLCDHVAKYGSFDFFVVNIIEHIYDV